MENDPRISSAAITDRGLSDKRPQNEDAFLEVGKCGIYAVADGVGGAQAGEVAAQMAVEILGEAFANRQEGADAEIVMRTAMERANTAIYQMAHELPQLSTMATTVVALHMDGNIATIGHVGDSRLYRVDRNGTLYRETDDHSMVAEEVRAGRMTEEQAENHPSRNIICRALGAEPEVSIDLKTILIDPGTAFLICTDGITRHVGDQEIKGVLTFGGSPDEVCQYLKNLCYERGAEDNLTAVVVKVAAVETAAAASANSYHDAEEATVATARAMAAPVVADEEEDDLLGLETLQMDKPSAMTLSFADHETFEDIDPEEQIEQDTVETTQDTIESSFEPAERGFPTDSAPPAPAPDEAPPKVPVVEQTAPAAPKQETPPATIPVDADARPPTYEDEKSGSVGKTLAAIAILLLGSVIGLGVYHFGLAPAPAQVGGNPVPVMQSEDIEFTSFEKNRRQVDADPAGYIKDLPPPIDAEDFYLRGRAQVLTGDFPQARLDLVEAQKRVLASPAMNRKILATDISIALMIANDTAIQPGLRTQIDSSLNPQTPANVNSNR